MASDRPSTSGTPPEAPRCTATSKRSGERCRNQAVPGSTHCAQHGGKTPAELVTEAPAPGEAPPVTVRAPAPPTRLAGTERLRAVLAGVLVVLAALSLMLASTGWWLERNFLDTDRFIETADEVLDQPEVKAALSTEIVKQIDRSTGQNLDLIEPFIASIVGQVVDSGAFRRVFNAAISTAHRALVDREIPEVTIDLEGTYQDIRSAVRAVSPRVARDMPEDVDINIDVINESDLEVVWDTIDLVENIVFGLTIAAVVLLFGGVALSPRRWRTLALASWIALGAFAFLLLALTIARRILLDRIENMSYREAAGATWDVVTHGLFVQSIWFLVIAGIIAIGAGWTGRNGGFAGARDAVVATYHRVRVALPARVPGEPEPAPGALAPATATADTRGTVETVGASVGIVVARLRLPEPVENARVRHVWRAIGLAALALFIFVWPQVLTTLVVVAVGLLVLYLAVTEALAAAASRRQRTLPAPGSSAP